jgi:hypothetical protein
MSKKRTLNTIEINGKEVNILDLPNTGFFKFEIYNMYGSNIERIIEKEYGKNVYGISHFVEHLGFRAPKDYTTDELQTLIKNEGAYNASTDYDRINYWFKTTMENRALAIKLVFNFAYNNLTRIPDEEFEAEKKVVYNEAKRYADDPQTMFYFNYLRDTCGLHEEDNVIGIPETIDTFTKEDAVMVKSIFNSYGKEVFNVTYDSEVCSQEEIIEIIKTEEAKFEEEKFSIKPKLRVTPTMYENALAKNENKRYLSNNASEQKMTLIAFDDDETNAYLMNKMLIFVASLSEGDSLTELIREQNGLTYGVYFYPSVYQYKNKILFGCDVTKGTEGKLLELFEQSLISVCDTFNEVKFNNFMKTTMLKMKMNTLNQESLTNRFDTMIFSPHSKQPFIEGAKIDFDEAYNTFFEECLTYDVMKKFLMSLKNKWLNKEYTIITN